MIKRKSSYDNPIDSFLSGSNNGARELDNKLIDYYHQVLNKYICYYRTLNHTERRKFINRLHEFIEVMDFKSAEGQEMNLKVCALCSAPAIQISMGLDTYIFNTFHTILVYPTKFYSEKLGRYVKGGTGKRDVIFFSFEDLLKGYAVPNDSLNLGLHEMAHAIHVEYFDEKFEAKFPEWERVALEELAKLRYEKDPVLRNYAGQNLHELFAVCVETFFEQPNELKKQTPALYEMMCDLLNQRPGQERVSH
jgi:MtfA peptidase